MYCRKLKLTAVMLFIFIGAVSDVRGEDPIFTFMQFSDVHVGHDNNIPHTRLQAAVALTNTLGVDFVIDTGDITNDPVYAATEENFAEYTEYKQYMSALTVPHYVAPGNHDIGYFDAESDPRNVEFADYDTLVARFEQEIGPLNQSFTYQGNRFVIINNNSAYGHQPAHLDPSQLEWIESEFQAARQNHEGIFVFGHVPVLENGTGDPWGESSIQLVELIDEYGVSLVAYGHEHDSIRTVLGGTLFVMCQDLKDNGHNSILQYRVFSDTFELWSYNVLTTEGTLLGTYPLHTPEPATILLAGIGILTLAGKRRKSPCFDAGLEI